MLPSERGIFLVVVLLAFSLVVVVWNEQTDGFKELRSIGSVLWTGLKSEPQNYQTIIAGFLAFIGVSATLFWNEWRIRRQFAHTLALDYERHRRELDQKETAVRSALLAEVTQISIFLRDEYWQAFKWDYGPHTPTQMMELYRFSLPDRTVIYRNLIGEISSLPYDEIVRFIQVYATYSNLPTWLEEHNVNTAEAGDIIRLQRSDVSELMALLEEIRREIDSVLAMIE